MNKPENTAVDENRVEDKYIVPKEHYTEVKHIVETHLPPYFPQPGVMYCINRSIYFDSPELTFLKQHLNKLDDRRKIRIRTYAPNGKWEGQYFLEIKSKTNGKSSKIRLKLSQKAFEAVMANSQVPVDNDLIIQNAEIPKDQVLQQVKLMNYLMMSNKVKPVVDITYKRHAYQANDSFRVTIDEDLKVKPLTLFKMTTIQDLMNQDLWDVLKKYGESFSNVEDFILEIKYQKKAPDWVEEMCDKMDLETSAFSKYVWSLYQVMNNMLKLIRNK